MPTDLTIPSDEVLDATLVRLYADHEAATEPGERAEVHLCITAVLAEQSRRLDAWIAGRS